MKLPDDKNERTKVLALIGIGAVAVLYMVIQLGIKPFLDASKEQSERIEELKTELTTARGIIKQMAPSIRKNTATLREIRRISDSSFLHPRLGNYLLVAIETLEARASTAGVQLGPITEGSMGSLPKKEDDTRKRVLKTYTAQVEVTCGYGDLLRLIDAIESENEYVAIVGMRIETQPKNPANHLIHFDVQWPIWDPALEESDLLRSLRALNDDDQDTGDKTEGDSAAASPTSPPPTRRVAGASRNKGRVGG